MADLTLGDSWGSLMSSAEQKKGISLILCQSDKGQELLSTSNAVLKKVDLCNAVKANHQLEHPSIMPRERAVFFKNVNGGFHFAMARCYPIIYYKYKLKAFLIKKKLIRREEH